MSRPVWTAALRRRLGVLLGHGGQPAARDGARDPLSDLPPERLDHLVHAMRLDGRLARLSAQQVENIVYALTAAGHMREYVSAKGSTFNADGLLTFHNSDFLEDTRFREAYALGQATGSWGEYDLRWRLYVVCWAAAVGRRLGGDFVECGVHRGFYSRAVMHYIDFTTLPERKFYLLDTYRGIPDEARAEVAPSVRDLYGECYEEVRRTFQAFPNAVLVRGRVPDTLSAVPSTAVCFLSIDMNHAASEVAAAAYFWDKLVPGAVVVLDDYGNGGWSLSQTRALDRFADARGVRILSLPTGQGLLVKS